MAHDSDLIALLTGFLVMGSMVLMVPTSLWFRVGATRINELMVLVNRLSFLTKIAHHESDERIKWPFSLSVDKRLVAFASRK
jgi:hypothetical protein